MPITAARTAASAALAVAAVALGPGPALGAATGWHRPVAGAVVRGFAYDPRSPFAAGARRNAWLRARPGGRVRAACSGAVVFAGAVPDGGQVVSVLCGRWRVTHLGVAGEGPAGRSVAAGQTIGRATGGRVGVGVRMAGEPWGYVDPERFLPVAPAPVGPVPVGPRGPRGAPRRPTSSPRPASGAQAHEAAPEPAPVPLVAYLGLGALAAGVAGSLRRRCIRRRRRLARTPAHAPARPPAHPPAAAP